MSTSPKVAACKTSRATVHVVVLEKKNNRNTLSTGEKLSSSRLQHRVMCSHVTETVNHHEPPFAALFFPPDLYVEGPFVYVFKYMMLY